MGKLAVECEGVPTHVIPSQEDRLPCAETRPVGVCYFQASCSAADGPDI